MLPRFLLTVSHGYSKLTMCVYLTNIAVAFLIAMITIK